MIERVARRLVVALLERIESGQLTLVEGPSRRVFGSGSPQATVVVHDPAVFVALARGGKGMAQTYVDGLWDSPDVTAVIEVAARNLEGIDRVRRAMTPVREPWQRGRSFLVRNTPLRAREDIAAHYDLGNDLFELMLDETMMYSAAIFETRETTLAEASRAKLDRICDKLDLGPGDHVLEIGTGWGGFAVHAAATRGCRVTTTTLSREQRELALERVRAAGLEDRVTVLLQRLPRARGAVRQARLDRDDRGRRLEGLRHVLRALRRAAAAGGRDGAAGDHDRRPPVRRREGAAVVHELADLPERLPAVRRGDRAQRRPPQ